MHPSLPAAGCLVGWMLRMHRLGLLAQAELDRSELDDGDLRTREKKGGEPQTLNTWEEWLVGWFVVCLVTSNGRLVSLSVVGWLAGLLAGWFVGLRRESW